jgi:hypothetical protein
MNRRYLWAGTRFFLVAGILVAGLAGCYSPPVVVGPVHSAIDPLTVMVFVPPNVPAHYTIVAHLDPFGLRVGGFGLSNGCGIGPRFFLVRLAREAGHLGANGILLVVRKIKPGTRYWTYCPGAGPVVRAEAIEVPRWNPRLTHILKILIPKQQNR